MKSKIFVLAMLFVMTAVVHGGVVVTNHDGSGGTFDVTTVSNLAAVNTPSGTTNRFGFDATEHFGQSFTLESPITLHSIYIGYTGYKTGSTLKLYIDKGADAASLAECEISFAGVVFDSGVVHAGANGGPWSYVQFDLSSEAIALGSGLHAYHLEMTSEASGSSSWPFAPSRNQSNTYAGGSATFNNVSMALTDDSHFAIAAIPEPASLILMGLGCLGLLHRRQ